MFKVTARNQGHYKGPSGAFVTYCNISCSLFFLFCFLKFMSKGRFIELPGHSSESKLHILFTERERGKRVAEVQ